mgnify:CR=1 FL=1
MQLTENGFDDSKEEGRQLGYLDAEAGIPSRFLMHHSKFSIGYRKAFEQYCENFPNDRKEAEKEFKKRCPNYGRPDNFG